MKRRAIQLKISQTSKKATKFSERNIYTDTKVKAYNCKIRIQEIQENNKSLHCKNKKHEESRTK